MNTKEVKSISEYISFIEDVTKIGTFWYRGVSNSNYKPTPGVVWQKIPIEVEGGLEHQFLMSYQSYTGEKMSAWDLYALMQHHGLPTRLLDWSESALVALFFALTSEPESESDRAVWIINPFELNKVTVGLDTVCCPSILANRKINEEVDIDNYLPINLKPAHLLRTLPCNPIAIYTSQHMKRVSSQKGCFTLNGYCHNTIDSYLENTEYCYLVNIKINSQEERLKMIKTLSKLGVDEEFIYQDLDSLCKKIKVQYKIPL